MGYTLTIMTFKSVMAALTAAFLLAGAYLPAAAEIPTASAEIPAAAAEIPTAPANLATEDVAKIRNIIIGQTDTIFN